MKQQAEVVVSVGTYHLPFDRLVEWVDSWARGNPEATVLLQHGVSRPGSFTQNVAMLSHGELLEAYASAKVLVLQGGAGGVMDSRAVGALPIVVPRRPDLHEVVDNRLFVFEGGVRAARRRAG